MQSHRTKLSVFRCSRTRLRIQVVFSTKSDIPTLGCLLNTGESTQCSAVSGELGEVSFPNRSSSWDYSPIIRKSSVSNLRAHTPYHSPDVHESPPERPLFPPADQSLPLLWRADPRRRRQMQTLRIRPLPGSPQLSPEMDRPSSRRASPHWVSRDQPHKI